MSWEDPLNDLPYSPRTKIALILDSNNKWCILADELGYSHDQIKCFERRLTAASGMNSPTSDLLIDWQQSRKPTLKEVYKLLVDLELIAAADVIKNHVQDGPKTSRNLPENNPRMSNHDIMLHISETDTPHQINRMRSTFQDTYQPMQDRPSNSTHNQKMASMKYNLDSETFLKECHRPTSLPHYCGNRCQPYLVYPQTHIDAQHAYSYAGLSSNIPPNHSGDHHSLLHTQNFIPSHPIHSTGVPQFHCSIQHTPHMPQSMSPQLRPQSSPLAHAIHMAYRPSCILQHPHITMGGYMSGSNSQQYSPYGTEPKPLTRNSPQQHTQLQLDFSPANQLPGNTHHQHHFPGHAMAHQPEYVTLTGRNTPVEHDTSMNSSLQ